MEDKTWNIFYIQIHEKSISIVEDTTEKIFKFQVDQMKNVEDKTCNIFKFQILEKSISIVEDRKLKIYLCPKLGTSTL